MYETSYSSFRGGLPGCPVGRDATGSFLDQSANVCFLDLQQSPTDNGGTQANGPQLL